jgi:hypothetical protein
MSYWPLAARLFFLLMSWQELPFTTLTFFALGWHHT